MNSFIGILFFVFLGSNSVSASTEAQNVGVFNDLKEELCFGRTEVFASETKISSLVDFLCLNREPINKSFTTGIVFWNWGKADEILNNQISELGVVEFGEISLLYGEFKVYTSPGSIIKDVCHQRWVESNSDFKTGDSNFTVHLNCTSNPQLDITGIRDEAHFLQVMAEKGFVKAPELKTGWEHNATIFVK